MKYLLVLLLLGCNDTPSPKVWYTYYMPSRDITVRTIDDKVSSRAEYEFCEAKKVCLEQGTYLEHFTEDYIGPISYQCHGKEKVILDGFHPNLDCGDKSK